MSSILSLSISRVYASLFNAFDIVLRSSTRCSGVRVVLNQYQASSIQLHVSTRFYFTFYANIYKLFSSLMLLQTSSSFRPQARIESRTATSPLFERLSQARTATSHTVSACTALFDLGKIENTRVPRRAVHAVPIDDIADIDYAPAHALDWRERALHVLAFEMRHIHQRRQPEVRGLFWRGRTAS